MKIIGLAGLHSSGKSHLCGILNRHFGWSCLNKRSILAEIWGKTFPTEESPEALAWYREIYRSVGPAELMVMVLQKAQGQNLVILDAIHNPAEWRAVKSLAEKAVLVGVFAPHAVRDSRNTPMDKLLDTKRVRHWHEDENDGYTKCLMSEIEWAFVGVQTEEVQILECRLLMEYFGLLG